MSRRRTLPHELRMLVYGLAEGLCVEPPTASMSFQCGIIEGGTGRRANADRPLTHQLDLGERGLAVKANRIYRNQHTGVSLSDFIAQRVALDDHGCLIWTGVVLSSGYGQGTFQGRRFLAHRFVYESLIGPIPAGLTIDHLCRVRSCVHPDHLEPVTQRVNNLRGTSPIPANELKTCCPKGHEYNYQDRRGWRQCTTCAKERRRAARRDAGIRPHIHTHCKNGHEFTPENTALTARGHRSCRACNRARKATRGVSVIKKELRQAVYTRDLGRCALCGGHLNFDDFECHHRKLRAQGGRDEMTNLIAVHGGYSVTSCHAKIHAHPRWAYRNGFLCPSYRDPASWPVLRHASRWEQPTTEGWIAASPAEGQLDIPDFQEGA